MDVLRFKQANCKNCYKCVRFCPVKSIRVYQGHAQIISSDCILCGNCVSVCPQHAKEDISDVAQIQELDRVRPSGCCERRFLLHRLF